MTTQPSPYGHRCPRSRPLPLDALPLVSLPLVVRPHVNPSDAPDNNPNQRLLDALSTLADVLTGTRLVLPGTAAAEATRRELAAQIDDYLLPRLQRLDAPLLAILGGSTGSGKSTITNSLAGVDVSPAGVLRPTTRAPVLICHPDDLGWFSGSDILGDLPRVTGNSDEPVAGQVLHLRPVASMTPGVAIIDAPDIDSVENANRELATQLLAAADLWLFVTTAVRYADAVPWEFLERARQRGTELALVMNRVPPGAADELVGHLAAMLESAGLTGATNTAAPGGGVPIFPIDEETLDDGRLAPDAIAGIRDLLNRLGQDADTRAAIVRSTLAGALDSLEERAAIVAAAVDADQTAADELVAVVEHITDQTHDRVTSDISSGTLLRSEVLDRWQELIGTGELMRAVQSRIGRWRDAIGAALTGRTAATDEVQGEITSTLEQLLIDHADSAALGIATGWKRLPGGVETLDGDRSLERASDRLRSDVGSEIRAWQGDVLDLVRNRGSHKRTAARALAIGVNSIGVTLMIAIFAQTGGLTGGEVAVASGTAGVSQALLNAVFGEQAVRDLAEEAKRSLSLRIGNLLSTDADRFRQRLTERFDSPETAAALEEARRNLATAVQSSHFDESPPS